jgi:hypothetical protein
MNHIKMNALAKPPTAPPAAPDSKISGMSLLTK